MSIETLQSEITTAHNFDNVDQFTDLDGTHFTADADGVFSVES